METPAGDDEQRNEGRGETSEAITHATVECPIAPEISQRQRLNGFVGFIACNVALGLLKRRADRMSV